MPTTLYRPAQFRKIALVWRTAPGQGRRVVGSLERMDQGYRFGYDGSGLDRALDEGFQGYPGMPDLRNVYNGQALASFASRLPSRERIGFDALMRAWGGSAEMNDFDLLGTTGGRLPTDMFEFISHVEPVVGTEFVTDLARVGDDRGTLPLEAFEPGTEFDLVPEPENAFDPQAIQVCYRGEQIGYLKTVHCAAVAQALREGIPVHARFERARTNGYQPEVIARVQFG